MTAHARTVAAFGAYLIAVGIVLVALPNVLLGVLALPTTDEPWIRLLGMVLVVLGGYYLACARAEETTFMRASVTGRLAIAVGHVALAIAWGYWVILLFALVDVVSAVWTWSALRASETATAPAPAV